MSGSTPPDRRALLVVEPDFLVRHVGVRRVIGHYWERLQQTGYDVALATARDGVLTLSDPSDQQRARGTILAPHPGRDAPVWTSRSTSFPKPGSLDVKRGEDEAMEWGGLTVRAADYEVSVLTNPWMCAREVPADHYTHGIAYDLVPNLSSSGALDLGEFIDVAAFAHEHHLGYLFYEEYARTVSCISRCTRSDFLRFYLRRAPGRAVVDVPFDSRQNDRVVVERTPPTADRPVHLLLVNALDHRKNLGGIHRTLLALAGERPLVVSVVGRERMHWHLARTFFTELADAGIDVRWYRDASDAQLDSLYEEADLLYFPSLYEGLGLPILEAQAHGMPVVSSSTSSCGEINLNPALTAEPTDDTALMGALRRALDPAADVLRGPALRHAMDRSIAADGRGLPWGDDAADDEVPDPQPVRAG